MNEDRRGVKNTQKEWKKNVLSDCRICKKMNVTFITSNVVFKNRIILDCIWSQHNKESFAIQGSCEIRIKGRRMEKTIITVLKLSVNLFTVLCNEHKNKSSS